MSLLFPAQTLPDGMNHSKKTAPQSLKEARLYNQDFQTSALLILELDSCLLWGLSCEL